ncbi:MAG TPA: branched-chain amino acid ABC transporter permease [Ktedonobacterales bacterium]
MIALHLTFGSSLLPLANAPFNWITLAQQLADGLALGAIYALIAIGYTMVYGIVELINFAHGDVFMWGSFAAFAVVLAFKIPEQVTGLALVGLLAGLLVFCALVSGGINVVVEQLAYKPLFKAPRLSLLIAAIGASFILEDIAFIWRGPSPLRFPPIFPHAVVSLGSVQIPALDIFTFILAVVLMIALDRFIKWTRIGRAMRATAQDTEAASLMGVNTQSTILITFLIGGALAGTAAVVYAMRVQQVYWFSGFEVGLIAFTAAVLGGIGDIRGAVLGGFLIGLVQAFAGQFFGYQWAEPIVFVVLVLVLALRPTGLIGVKSVDKA